MGGEVFYKYLGAGSTPGTSIYQVSLRLFRDCDVACGGTTGVACLPIIAVVSVYPAVSPYSPFYILNLPLTDSTSITLANYPKCIANKPLVCYEIKTYTTTVTLPDTNEGYIVTYQNCCRAESENQYGTEYTASGKPGATYTASIPGKNILATAHNNSSIFTLKDTALVCAGAAFSIDFGADDPDKDSLSYAFAPAYNGGDYYSDGCVSMQDGSVTCQDAKPGPPPYNFITYRTDQNFSGTQPLGPAVSINAATGLISGTAPSIDGHYIVNVIAYEWRDGNIITTHQKDFIIHVEDCNIPEAKMKPVFENCKGFDLTFENNSVSTLINSYYWDFGDTKNFPDTSVSKEPAYTYSDSGTYVVTLITNKGQDCSDTATALAKIYPGFTPAFDAGGGCISVPYTFTDLTLSKYGTVNNWRWDFGDLSTTADTSIIQKPQYTYQGIRQAEVRLIVGDSKGCVDSITKIIQLYDKPPLTLPFNDTLICAKDSVQLQAIDSINTAAVYNWSPPVNISNIHISNPVVYPTSTTVYHIDVSNAGCTNSDSVKIEVIPFVTLDVGNDTTICLTDNILLSPATNAVYFTWSPSTGLSDATAKAPLAIPPGNIIYTLVARVGGCTATDSIKINAMPYPMVSAGTDTAICFGRTAELYANTSASLFTWSPVNSLLRANTLTPTAGPQTTTAYIITVNNLQGCLKPVSDTTIVTVTPPVHPFAGNDTAIVANQPLQLNATGGAIYSWSPAIGMDNAHIADPVVVLGPQYDSITYHVTVSTANGCSAIDDIKVVVFKTQPDIFIPSAFTPNSDGLNDVLRPVVAGMKQLNYFRVFNRWGQMLFNTSAIGQGWDGRLSGKLQASGTYVYMISAIDYTGKAVTKKGTVVLIR
ncbi:MAG TPA: PKD domain-containing protein [Parafilimonas sp.]|nr:PKD domain-containing protein [Parafilimonas sp.]